MKEWMQQWGGSAVVHADCLHYEPRRDRYIDQEREDRLNQTVNDDPRGESE